MWHLTQLFISRSQFFGSADSTTGNRKGLCPKRPVGQAQNQVDVRYGSQGPVLSSSQPWWAQPKIPIDGVLHLQLCQWRNLGCDRLDRFWGLILGELIALNSSPMWRNTQPKTLQNDKPQAPGVCKINQIHPMRSQNDAQVQYIAKRGFRVSEGISDTPDSHDGFTISPKFSWISEEIWSESYAKNLRVSSDAVWDPPSH